MVQVALVAIVALVATVAFIVQMVMDTAIEDKPTMDIADQTIEATESFPRSGTSFGKECEETIETAEMVLS